MILGHFLSVKREMYATSFTARIDSPSFPVAGDSDEMALCVQFRYRIQSKGIGTIALLDADGDAVWSVSGGEHCPFQLNYLYNGN